jgi:hypothetical protein
LRTPRILLFIFLMFDLNGSPIASSTKVLVKSS